MNLYQALQGILTRVNAAATDAKYNHTDQEMLKAILENQGRLAESMVLLGGLLQGILAEDVEVHVMSREDEAKH